MHTNWSTVDVLYVNIVCSTAQADIFLLFLTPLLNNYNFPTNWIAKP